MLRTSSLWRPNEGDVDFSPINVCELFEATRIDDVNQILSLTSPSSCNASYAETKTLRHPNVYRYFQLDKTADCLWLDYQTIDAVRNNGSTFRVRDESELSGVVIAYCCSQNSELCDERFAQISGGRMLLVRLPEADDMTSKEGLENAMQIIRKHKHVPSRLWSSIPCTGGSIAQARNVHNANHKSNIAAHHRKFQKLRKNLTTLANEITENTACGHFTFEWPTKNTWWSTPEMKRMKKRFQMLKVNVDGCKFGMKNKNGERQLKPWTLMTTSTLSAHEFQGMTCHEKHVHAPIVGGKVAEASAYYPFARVERIQAVSREALTDYLREKPDAEAAAVAVQYSIDALEVNKEYIVDTGCGRDLCGTIRRAKRGGGAKGV